MAHQTAPQPQRRPYGVACTSCRRSKMKCVTSDPEAAACDRCQRLGRHCIFESHRRGLWRRDVSGRREERVIPADNNLEEMPSTSHSSSSNQPSGYQSRAPESVSASSRSDQSPFTASSFVTNFQGSPRLFLGAALSSDRPVQGDPRGYLDTHQQSLPETANLTRKYDPVDMGLISLPSAQNIYEAFFKHFNCLVGLLDPNMYTFSYTRSRSSLLFTMILTISSRVFQPEVHQSIRCHSEFLLGGALLACDSAIENIWAVICMYHWKDIDDARGYTLIGFALRMAATAEWNMTSQRVSYGSGELEVMGELEVRQKRDQERIWLILCNIDRTSSYFTDRLLSNTLVVDHVASRHWLTLTEWTYTLGDVKAVGGHELTRIARKIYESIMGTRADRADIPPQSSCHSDSFQKDMDDFNSEIMDWADHWRSSFATVPNYERLQTPLIHLFRDYMRLYFNSVLLHRMLLSESRSLLDNEITHTMSICYSSALSALRQTIKMGELDIIYYLWDTAHIMISYAFMMIPRLLKKDVDETVVTKDEAVDILTQVTTIYVVAAKAMGNPESRTNTVSIQAHLFYTVLAHLRADLSQTETMPDNTSGPSLSWIEDQLNRSALFSDRRMEPRQLRDIDMEVRTAEQPEEIGSYMPHDLGLMLDDDFMSLRYSEIGLMLWDESDIFSQPH